MIEILDTELVGILVQGGRRLQNDASPLANVPFGRSIPVSGGRDPDERSGISDIVLFSPVQQYVIGREKIEIYEHGRTGQHESALCPVEGRSGSDERQMLMQKQKSCQICLCTALHIAYDLY